MFRELTQFKELWILPVMLSFILGMHNVKSESCPPFISTINNVDKCPENKTEWLKATERKQCNRINPKCTEIHYHCLPDRFLGQFIEVCAAPKLIVGHNCPFYDLERNSIEPNFNQQCREDENPCPEIYYSSSVFKYQGCYKESLDNKKAQTNDNRNPHIFETNYRMPQIGFHEICMLLIAQIILSLIIIFCQDGCKQCLKRIYQRFTKMKHLVIGKEKKLFIPEQDEA